MLGFSKYILAREDLRIVLEDHNSYFQEKIEIKDGDNWITILSSSKDYNTLTFWSQKKVSSKPLSFNKQKKKKLYFQTCDEDISLNLDYCLEEKNILHIRYKLSANRDLSLSKIIIKYNILLGKNPDFTWVPHICPKKYLVIGDHVFRSPVIIYKKENIAFALVPDLKTLTQNHPFQTFMNLNLNPEDQDVNAQISYGFGNYKSFRHILFKHEQNKLWEIKADTDLTFRYYILVFKEKNDSEILTFINNFFWEKFGRKLLYLSFKPQILPYDINVKEGFDAIFKRHQYWGDLTINNVECGGFWVQTWYGKEKLPLKFIQTNDRNEYTQRHSKKNRIAVIFNNAWFLNIRSAYGIRFFGELWNDNNLIQKSNRMLNTILELPRTNGIFPSLIFPKSNDTDEFFTANGIKAWFYIDDFNVVDASLAMYWAIKISNDYSLKKDLVQSRSKELFDLIKIIQLKNGTIPHFINFDKKNNPFIIKDLIDSASSGSSLMFLTEFYKISKDEEIIPLCEGIARFLQNEIISKNKWHDFETFYSCTYPGITDYDEYTESHLMNTLCIYWCAEGFKDLYKITGKTEYLKSGERILAILSLFQQVWNMPYISIDTFGGFGVQNADAELNDARQGLFVRTYIEYYLETGNKEYMERGIAALRASWALQLLDEYKDICPGNFIGLETVNEIDKGCVRENYGHSGRDEKISGYIMFDWGVGSAAMAVAYVKKHIGDLFLDFKEKLVWGIDGLLIKKFEFCEDSINIILEQISGKSNFIIKAREAPENPIEIIINEKSLGRLEKYVLEKGIIKKIMP